MSRFNARAAIVIAATIVVIAYCLGLLAHVQASPDIGMQTTLDLQVGKFYRQYLRDPDQPDVPDLVGCTIRQIGPYAVDNWPAYLGHLRDLQAKHPSELQVQQPTPGSSNFEEESDGKKWVLVVLQRGDQKPFEVWCHLGRPPLEITMPALLWLVLEVGLFAIGAFVFWKRPEYRYAGPFFALTTVAVGAYLGGYHWSQISTQPMLTTAFVVSAVLLPAGTMHFYHGFPRPKSGLLRPPRLALSAPYGFPSPCAR